MKLKLKSESQVAINSGKALIYLDAMDRVEVFRQTFLGWEKNRPDQQERLPVVGAYLDLSREVMDLLADSRPPAR